MDKKEYLMVVLKSLEHINTLNDVELKKLLKGDYEFTLKPSKVVIKEQTDLKESNDNNYEEYVKVIYSSGKGNEVHEFIKSLDLTKDKLITLAKYMCIKINKKSKKDEVIDKIVETLVDRQFKRDIFGDEY